MIGQLRGIIIHKDPPLLVIDVNGVGYEVHASMNTFHFLPADNTTVTLLVHMLVREDAHHLYGFVQEQERQLFRVLIKVSGVGPKLALTVLSGMDPSQFVHCVQTKDSKRLVNIPGIGKKTAERLIMETHDALAGWQFPVEPQQSEMPLHGRYQPIHDAISALTALGYKPLEARQAVNEFTEHTQNVEELIRMALQQLAKGAK